MNEELSHLEKAKNAIAAAAEMTMDIPVDEELPKGYHRLWDIANIQTRLAEAEALTRIADHLTGKDKHGRTN